MADTTAKVRMMDEVDILETPFTVLVTHMTQGHLLLRAKAANQVLGGIHGPHGPGAAGAASQPQAAAARARVLQVEARRLFSRPPMALPGRRLKLLFLRSSTQDTACVQAGRRLRRFSARIEPLEAAEAGQVHLQDGQPIALQGQDLQGALQARLGVPGATSSPGLEERSSSPVACGGRHQPRSIPSHCPPGSGHGGRRYQRRPHNLRVQAQRGCPAGAEPVPAG